MGPNDSAHARNCVRSAVIHVESILRVRLPAGGWQVGFRVQRDGRTAIEVTDSAGWLTGVVVSTRRPVVSIDSGWAGHVGGRGDRRQQWWSLAIGHVPPCADPPTVTFTRKSRPASRGQMTHQPDAVDGLWVVYDGLWVGAATGHYTHVQLSAQSATRVRRLQLATRPDPLRGERPAR